MKTSILAAGLLLLAGSAMPAAAYDSDGGHARARVQHEDDYNPRGRAQGRVIRGHEVAREVGSHHRRHHWRFHNRWREAHDYDEGRGYGGRHHRRWSRWYN
jgi:hypothetical protein